MIPIMVIESVDGIVQYLIERDFPSVEMEDVEPRFAAGRLEHLQIVALGELRVLFRCDVVRVDGLACKEQAVGASHLQIVALGELRVLFLGSTAWLAKNKPSAPRCTTWVTKRRVVSVMIFNPWWSSSGCCRMWEAADKAAIQRVEVPPCQLPDSGT